MSAPADPPNNAQPEPSDDSHVDFLKADLEICFTFATVAETKFRVGHSESADSALEKAQQGFNTVQRLLSDPAHAKYLTDEEIQNITAELERLRARIYEVRQRFKK
jgi:hypothetical protein